MQIWAESGKSALPICNYSQILYQFLTFTQNLKRSRLWLYCSYNRESLIRAIRFDSNNSIFDFTSVISFSIVDIWTSAFFCLLMSGTLIEMLSILSNEAL